MILQVLDSAVDNGWTEVMKSMDTHFKTSLTVYKIR